MIRRKVPGRKGQTVDLSRYTFSLIISTANKLNSGASSWIGEKFGIGVEAWRVLAMIAACGHEITAQQMCQFSGMDKGAVSRTLGAMENKGLIVLRTAEDDGRLKLAMLTAKGKKMHDLIVRFQLEREKALLSGLSPAEVEIFIDLLSRARANLPNVDLAAEAYAKKHWHSLKPMV